MTDRHNPADLLAACGVSAAQFADTLRRNALLVASIADHAGPTHVLCRMTGPQTVAFTRCCNQRLPIEQPTWPCEIEALVPLDCCDRPYPIFGTDTPRAELTLPTPTPDHERTGE